MAGGGDTSGSLFRVGDNVEVWRVLAMISILVFWIVVLEFGIHKLSHHLKRFPKYHEMMTKVFGELMILGLIGFGVKIIKEMPDMDPYSPTLIAFQAADLTIFIMALGLVIQAVVIFLRLRRKNIQVDKAELISTPHLIEHIESHPPPSWGSRVMASLSFCWSRRRSKRTLQPGDIGEVARTRVLRHYFLQNYGLPEVFPFSKYMRQAQDNQLSHMIEVRVFTWMILLLVTWGFEVLSFVLKKHVDIGDEHYAIVTSFMVFSWLAVAIHVLITAYFTWALNKLVQFAVGNIPPKKRNERYEYLKAIALQEDKTANYEHEHAADAIARMEQVREQEHSKNQHRIRSFLKKRASTFLFKSSRKMAREGHLEQGLPLQDRGAEPIPLPFFSRRVWHFVVILSLMLNAFYFALFCQCVLYRMHQVYKRAGYVGCILVPLPLVINMCVFQPRMMRNFTLVSSIVRVDDKALGDVIDHFTETIQLRAEFVRTIHTHLASNSQTLADLQQAFEQRDRIKMGLLEVDDVRLVLKRFGFDLSYFRFNSVAKLLFDLNGTAIEYSQVVRLVALGQPPAPATNGTEAAPASPPSSRTQWESRTEASAWYTRQASLTTMPSTGQYAFPALQHTRTSVAQSLYRIDFEERNSDGMRYVLI